MKSSPRSIVAGVFLLALSIIVFEIGLTRVFAIMMWHHFTYMVISLGLLGFGASGSILTARREGLKSGSPSNSLTRLSLLYGVSVMVAFFAATLVPIDSLAIWQKKANFFALLLIYLIVSVPFLFGGMAIGLALTRVVEHVNKLYFFDLVGSALGAGVSVLLLANYGSTATVIVAGCIGLLAAFMFGLGATPRHRWVTVPALLAGCVLAISFSGGWPSLGIPAGDWEVPFAPGKEGSLKPPGWVLDRIPSATAEVEVSPSVVGIPTIGGDFRAKGHLRKPLRGAGQDGTAPTVFLENAADVESFPFLTHTQAASAYVARLGRGAAEPKVMVIGVGGAMDVLVALAYQATHITAVEINAAMIEMVSERYADYMGRLFDPKANPRAKDIDLVHGEGRSYLRNSRQKFDIIQMSGVDSYTALSTGAYTLSESYLYTTDAVKDFYDHLEDGGIVNYSRWIMSRPRMPRETLRLANIAYTALEELGIEDPASHIAIYQGNKWASTMIKKGPFLPAEIEALRTFAKDNSFVGFVFDPLWPANEPIKPALRHVNTARDVLTDMAIASPLFAGADAKTIDSVVDDLGAAILRMAANEPLSDALLPARLAGADVRAWALRSLEATGPQVAARVNSIVDTQGDFAHVLRASDGDRAQFIANYGLDISVATDDKPFFFNYYRYRNLFAPSTGRLVDPKLFQYDTDFPVGHLVLLISMLQIVALAAVMILLPLRRLSRVGLRTPGAWRYFAYFGALGVGFMSIEITLMQKMVIFLGHPTYALSVVLAGLLGFAGLGSFLAGRITTITNRHLRLMLGAVIVVILFDAMAVNLLLPAILGQTLIVRIFSVLLLLLPTGLALGMLFPTGMRIVKAQCPQLLPWGWAVNAFCSVFASIFCVVLSMQIGFTNVLLFSMLVYVAGVLPMRILPVTADAAGPGEPAPAEQGPAEVARPA